MSSPAPLHLGPLIVILAHPCCDLYWALILLDPRCRFSIVFPPQLVLSLVPTPSKGLSLAKATRAKSKVQAQGPEQKGSSGTNAKEVKTDRGDVDSHPSLHSFFPLALNLNTKKYCILTSGLAPISKQSGIAAPPLLTPSPLPEPLLLFLSRSSL
jgi:hypothetical protein